MKYTRKQFMDKIGAVEIIPDIISVMPDIWYEQYCKDYDAAKKTGAEFDEVIYSELKKGDVIFNYMLQEWVEILMDTNKICISEIGKFKIWFVKI